MKRTKEQTREQVLQVLRRAPIPLTLAGATIGVLRARHPSQRLIMAAKGGFYGAWIGHAAAAAARTHLARLRAGQGAGSQSISRPLTGDYLAQHNLTHGRGGRFTAKGAKKRRT